MNDWTGNNRRKRVRAFGINFEIPVTWLIAVIVLGLVQFGVFYRQFEELKETVDGIKRNIGEVAISVQSTVEHNSVQDSMIREHDRRLNRIEK